MRSPPWRTPGKVGPINCPTVSVPLPVRDRICVKPASSEAVTPGFHRISRTMLCIFACTERGDRAEEDPPPREHHMGGVKPECRDLGLVGAISHAPPCRWVGHRPDEHETVGRVVQNYRWRHPGVFQSHATIVRKRDIDFAVTGLERRQHLGSHGYFVQCVNRGNRHSLPREPYQLVKQYTPEGLLLAELIQTPNVDVSTGSTPGASTSPAPMRRI